MPAPERFGHDVFVLLPGCPTNAVQGLVEQLHRLDRTIGVGHGREGGVPLVIVMTSNPDPLSAEAAARRLLAEAGSAAKVPESAADTAIVKAIEPRRLSPGRPHEVSRPVGVDATTVRLGDGRALSAVYEGPVGDWIVWLEDGGRLAWRGRDLHQALAELFALPHAVREPWVHDVIRALAGRETPAGVRYPCPCCDCFTLEEPPSGTYAICPVCWWEDDGVQFSDPDYRGGANRPSLREARESFMRRGVAEERLRPHARSPLPYELP